MGYVDILLVKKIDNLFIYCYNSLYEYNKKPKTIRFSSITKGWY